MTQVVKVLVDLSSASLSHCKVYGGDLSLCWCFCVQVPSEKVHKCDE